MWFKLSHTDEIKRIVDELNDTNIETNKEKYDELIHSLFDTILKQFEEFRDQMHMTKIAYSLDPDTYKTQRREITLIWSEMRDVINSGINKQTLPKMNRLYFEALNIYSTYVNIGFYIW